ncbi:probable G-protein coupled receptor 148 [Denticeps clupeoides]|nr:probable G-protein coupled receptor 148 [Denticeps clupeoides]
MTIILNISQIWLDTMHSRHMELFFIPAIFLTVTTLLVNPLLLICIFCLQTLRQETRYLLLANTLMADMVFLCLNLAIVICALLGVTVLRIVCELVIAGMITAYCCTILTITFMVVDTYVAVRWPLKYNKLLPPSRTLKIMVGIWLMASMYPISLVIVMEAVGVQAPHQLPLCLVLLSLGSLGLDTTTVGVHLYFAIGVICCFLLILYCYVRLYVVTRTSGIWQQRYSRARLTLLAHCVMLLLYFSPALVFTVELGLFQNNMVSQEVSMWITMSNMSMLMLLPRASSPFLYGLRYREIYHKLTTVLWRRQRLSQVSVQH